MRILIVENHQDTREWLSWHLERRGHSIATAQTLREGALKLGQMRHDVLITNIGLPDGSGWNLLQPAQSSPLLLAIAMSGLGTNADMARSKAAGFHHHLFKPFPLTYLDRLLAEAQALLPER